MIKPRGKGKIGKVLGLKDAYKVFKKTKLDSSFTEIDYRTYKAICASFNKRSVESIILNSTSLHLPYRLGKIRIKKQKMSFSNVKKLSVDWVKSKAEGIRVYHLNDHRDNFKYKWFWEKKNINIPNRAYYSFIPTRTNKRTLANVLLNKRDVDYFE